MRSVGERVWRQVKRIFLREQVKKELATQIMRELGTSELNITAVKQSRLIFSFFSGIARSETRSWTDYRDSPCS